MSSRIMQYITPQERSLAMKAGAYACFHEAGVPFNEIDGIVKKSVDLPSANGVAKSIIALSVLTGIPVGIASHLVGRKLTNERGREKELSTEAGYYRNATHQLQRGMQAGTALD